MGGADLKAAAHAGGADIDFHVGAAEPSGHNLESASTATHLGSSAAEAVSLPSAVSYDVAKRSKSVVYGLRIGK